MKKIEETERKWRVFAKEGQSLDYTSWEKDRVQGLLSKERKSLEFVFREKGLPREVWTKFRRWTA